MYTRQLAGLALALCLGSFAAASNPAAAQAPVATYQFNNTLSADQSGVAALTAVDPLTQNAFTTATVFNQTRTVYTTSGATTPASQAGLLLDPTSLISNPGTYSIQDVFAFNTTGTGFRRILEVDGRVSDSGLYAYPNASDIGVYNLSNTGPQGAFTDNVFHDLVLTVADTGGGTGTVTGYLDGTLAFTDLGTNLENIITGNPLGFYLDNTQGSGIGEYADTSTALIQLYNQTLTAPQVAALDGQFPRTPAPAVPEPCSFALLGLGLLPIALVVRRRRA